MEFRDYLRMLTVRWPLILGCTLLLAALAAVLTLRATPQYTSTAQLFVTTPQSDGNEAYQGGLFSQQRAKSYARLITGEEVSQRVIDALDVDMTATELSRQTKAEVVLDTVILSVSVTDTDPELAQRLTQETAKQFVGYVAELETPDGQDLAPVKASIVDPASLPESPVSPRPLVNLALGLLGGLVLGLGIAVLRELMDTSIKSPEDLARVLDTPILAGIMLDKDTPSTPLITSLDSHHPRVEATRILRTNLQFSDLDEDCKVVVISSAVPGEGKSTVAANLALAAGEAGRSVVIVEGDLRRPRISDYLGIEGSVGLSTVLLGRVGLDEALQETSSKNVVALGSGLLPPNPSEVLQTSAMARLVDTLRSKFDLVVIDAPPLLPVTDAALLATLADGAVLIVRHGKTTREQARLSVERLEAVGARLLGVVMNMTPKRGAGWRAYGYGYGYGNTYSPDEIDPRARASEPRKSSRGELGRRRA